MSAWQPISSALKDGGFIIAYDPAIGAVSQIWWCPLFKMWESLHNDYPMRDCVDGQHYIFKCNPTHWQPLPAPPEAP